MKLGNKKYIVYPKIMMLIIGFIGQKQLNLMTIRTVVYNSKQSRIREDLF